MQELKKFEQVGEIFHEMVELVDSMKSKYVICTYEGSCDLPKEIRLSSEQLVATHLGLDWDLVVKEREELFKSLTK